MRPFDWEIDAPEFLDEAPRTPWWEDRRTLDIIGVALAVITVLYLIGVAAGTVR